MHTTQMQSCHATLSHEPDAASTNSELMPSSCAVTAFVTPASVTRPVPVMVTLAVAMAPLANTSADLQAAVQPVMWADTSPELHCQHGRNAVYSSTLADRFVDDMLHSRQATHAQTMKARQLKV